MASRRVVEVTKNRKLSLSAAVSGLSLRVWTTGLTTKANFTRTQTENHLTLLSLSLYFCVNIKRLDEGNGEGVGLNSTRPRSVPAEPFEHVVQNGLPPRVVRCVFALPEQDVLIL